MLDRYREPPAVPPAVPCDRNWSRPSGHRVEFLLGQILGPATVVPLRSEGIQLAHPVDLSVENQ